MATPRATVCRSLTRSPGIVELAGGDFLQPGDHPQQGRLAAAGRPDEDRGLAAFFDVEVDAVNDFDLAVLFLDSAQADIGLIHQHAPNMRSRLAKIPLAKTLNAYKSGKELPWDTWA